MSLRSLLLFSLITILLCGMHITKAEVIVEPFGMAASLGEGESTNETLTLFNTGEEPVTYKIKYIDPDRDRQQQGPHRDDPWDEIATFDLPRAPAQAPTYAKNWDNGLMYLSTFAGFIDIVDPDGYEVIRSVQPGLGSQGDCAWLDGIYYVNIYNSTNCARYDSDLNRLDGDLRLPFNPMGIASDVDNNWFFVKTWSGAGSRVSVFDGVNGVELGEQLGVIQLPHDPWTINWVPQHAEGQLWYNMNQQGGDNSVKQVLVDTEEWRAIRVVAEYRSPANFSNMLNGIGHDGFNIWLSGNQQNRCWVMDDGIEEVYIRWVTVEPKEGELRANEDFDLDVFFNTEGIEPGTYHMHLELQLNDPEQPSIIVSMMLTVEDISADVHGVVTDAATDEVIPWVNITMDRYLYQRETNRNGAYEMPNLPAGQYQLTFTAPDYLPFITDMEVADEEDVELNIAMLHSQCNLSVEMIQTILQPDMSANFDFQVTNNGNGPLTYRTEKELLGDANAEPWEYRRGYPISEIAEDDRVQGVVFANDHFYVAGSAARQKKMYVISREGELLDTYDQFSTSTYGYCDLAWDGELIWGTGERRVYGFTPEGELVLDWDGPFATNNNLAWDSDRESLWVNGNTTNIVLMSRDGNRGRELNRQGLRVYGLSYWPEDPDGYNLYIFHNPTGEVQAVTKMHPVSGDTLSVVVTEPDGAGRPAASFITNEFDVYSWVFMTISNPGATDRIDIWQLDARKDWMAVDPTEGVIEAGASEDFVLTLDATGLPIVRFEGQIVFYHDGVSGRTVLPIILDVAEGRVETVRRYDFTAGWNMISFNLEPEIENVVELFQPLVEQDLLVMLKDGRGRFYRPEFGFNNIPRWVVSEGYQARFTEATSLDVRGITMMVDDPIQLTAGWQIISYYPRQQVDAVVGFANIVDNLEIAKDVAGRFYLPAWGFSNMGMLREGQGYQVKMTDPDELVINFQRVASDLSWNSQALIPKHSVEPTGDNMSVLALSDNLSGEIGIYAGDRLLGSGVLSNGATGIAVWGNADLMGRELRVVKFTPEGSEDVQIENLSGEGVYTSDGLWVVRISESTVPSEYGLASVYPNPFNMTSRALFRMPESGKVTAVLFDVSGRQVLEVFNGKMNTGEHHLTIDGSSLSAGVYVLQVNASGKTWRQKLALVK